MENRTDKQISKVAIQRLLLLLKSLLQGYDLHGLAVQCDSVIYARGDGRHCNLDGPVALGEAGHYGLVHADWDLDQT